MQQPPPQVKTQQQPSQKKLQGQQEAMPEQQHQRRETANAFLAAFLEDALTTESAPPKPTARRTTPGPHAPTDGSNSSGSNRQQRNTILNPIHIAAAVEESGHSEPLQGFVGVGANSTTAIVRTKTADSESTKPKQAFRRSRSTGNVGEEDGDDFDDCASFGSSIGDLSAHLMGLVREKSKVEVGGESKKEGRRSRNSEGKKDSKKSRSRVSGGSVLDDDDNRSRGSSIGNLSVFLDDGITTTTVPTKKSSKSKSDKKDSKKSRRRLSGSSKVDGEDVADDNRSRTSSIDDLSAYYLDETPTTTSVPTKKSSKSKSSKSELKDSKKSRSRVSGGSAVDGANDDDDNRSRGSSIDDLSAYLDPTTSIPTKKSSKSKSDKKKDSKKSRSRVSGSSIVDGEGDDDDNRSRASSIDDLSAYLDPTAFIPTKKSSKSKSDKKDPKKTRRHVSGSSIVDDDDDRSRGTSIGDLSVYLNELAKAKTTSAKVEHNNCGDGVHAIGTTSVPTKTSDTGNSILKRGPKKILRRKNSRVNDGQEVNGEDEEHSCGSSLGDLSAHFMELAQAEEADNNVDRSESSFRHKAVISTKKAKSNSSKGGKSPDSKNDLRQSGGNMEDGEDCDIDDDLSVMSDLSSWSMLLDQVLSGENINLKGDEAEDDEDIALWDDVSKQIKKKNNGNGRKHNRRSSDDTSERRNIERSKSRGDELHNISCPASFKGPASPGKGKDRPQRRCSSSLNESMTHSSGLHEDHTHRRLSSFDDSTAPASCALDNGITPAVNTSKLQCKENDKYSGPGSSFHRASETDRLQRTIRVPTENKPSSSSRKEVRRCHSTGNVDEGEVDNASRGSSIGDLASRLNGLTKNNTKSILKGDHEGRNRIKIRVDVVGKKQSIGTAKITEQNSTGNNDNTETRARGRHSSSDKDSTPDILQSPVKPKSILKTQSRRPSSVDAIRGIFMDEENEDDSDFVDPMLRVLKMSLENTRQKKEQSDMVNHKMKNNNFRNSSAKGNTEHASKNETRAKTDGKVESTAPSSQKASRRMSRSSQHNDNDRVRSSSLDKIHALMMDDEDLKMRIHQMISKKMKDTSPFSERERESAADENSANSLNSSFAPNAKTYTWKESKDSMMPPMKTQPPVVADKRKFRRMSSTSDSDVFYDSDSGVSDNRSMASGITMTTTMGGLAELLMEPLKKEARTPQLVKKKASSLSRHFNAVQPELSRSLRSSKRRSSSFDDADSFSRDEFTDETNQRILQKETQIKSKKSGASPDVIQDVMASLQEFESSLTHVERTELKSSSTATAKKHLDTARRNSKNTSDHKRNVSFHSSMEGFDGTNKETTNSAQAPPEQATKVICLPWVDRRGLRGNYTGEVNAMIQPHGKGALVYDSGFVLNSMWCNGTPSKTAGSASLTQGSNNSTFSPSANNSQNTNTSAFKVGEEAECQSNPSYVLGCHAKSQMDMITESSPEEALKNISLLKVFDFAFVRRTNNKWTYSIISDRDADVIRFVVDELGRTKSLERQRWLSNIRRVRAKTDNVQPTRKPRPRARRRSSVDDSCINY